MFERKTQKSLCGTHKKHLGSKKTYVNLEIRTFVKKKISDKNVTRQNRQTILNLED